MKMIEKIINKIKNANKIGLVHHTDPDGVTSGVIFAKSVEKLGKKIDFRLNQKGNEIKILDQTIEKLRLEEVDLVCITDLGTDQYPEQIKKIEEFANVIILDHHKVYNDLNSEKTIMIKPLDLFKVKDPSQYCAAKLVYDVFKDQIDIKELDWIKTIGLIGDCGFKEFSKEIDEVLDKYNIKHTENYFDNKLGQCAQIMSYAESYDESVIGHVFDIVYNAKKYEDILNSDIKKYKKEIQEEIDRCIKEIREENFIGNLILYKMKSKFHIKSKISTILSFQHKDKTVVIAQENDNITISARRQDGKVKVNDLLEKAVEGFGSAGGHGPAAGGTINKEDWSKFKEKIISLSA